MKNQQKNLLTIILIAVLAIAIFVYIYKDLHKSTTIVQQVPKENPEVVPVSVDPNKSGQGYTVKVIDTQTPVKTVAKAPQMPDLELAVVNHAHIDDVAFKIMAENIAILVKSIKKDQADESNWLNLAIYRKNIGDYDVSADILNYVAKIWPKDYVPYNNLADLYQFYIKNYSLAEKNWLKVIDLKPNLIQAYQNLSELYATQFIEKQAQSLPILLTGLDKNPQNIDLIISVARRYKVVGNTVQASVYYSKAITEAKNQNNQQLVVSLEQESDQ